MKSGLYDGSFDVLKTAAGVLHQCTALQQHILTAVHGVYFKSLASACHAASHCNMHCLIIIPTP
jgi:hypothetical protein